MTSTRFHKWLAMGTLSALASLPTSAAKPPEQTKLKSEATNIVKTFAGALKPKLVSAIRTGGLDHAIKTCSVEAPKIAKQLSQNTGWSVKRVSLKPRNSASATADAFERNVLEQFDKRQHNGEQASTMSYAELSNNQYRFIKAQGVEGVCLNCHGQTVSADVQKSLKALYPNDQASGYALGEIRGAISLTKKW